MEKLHVLIADSDEFYLNRLGNYLMEKAPNFEVASFTSEESLLRYTGTAQEADLLIVSPDLLIRRPELKTIGAKAKIVAGDGGNYEFEGFRCINKYQKSEKFLNEILLAYAESTGKTDLMLHGNHKTRVVGFFSPAGGVGKTVLSLAAAVSAASMGMSVFYLNLEKLSSAAGVLNGGAGEEKNLSEVFLALKTKGGNPGLKLLTNTQTDTRSHVCYIDPPESMMEYEEVSVEEMVRLLSVFEEMGEYQILILDFDSQWDESRTTLLEQCDLIFMPFSSDLTSLCKLKRLMHEKTLHRPYGELLERSRVIFNRSDPSTAASAARQCGLDENKDVTAAIPYSPLLGDARGIPGAGGALAALMKDVVREIIR